MERSAQVFGDSPDKGVEPDIKTMQAKIGQLTLENDLFEHALTKAGLLSAFVTVVDLEFLTTYFKQTRAMNPIFIDRRIGHYGFPTARQAHLDNGWFQGDRSGMRQSISPGRRQG